MNKIFQEEVLRVVRRIPRGRVLSYGEVARRAGSPRAFRAVGSIMSQNKDPHVPCHRVIRSDGFVGGYNGGGEGEKARRLRTEGVLVYKNKVIAPIV